MNQTTSREWNPAESLCSVLREDIYGIMPKTIKKDIRDIIESLKPIEDDTETTEENIINYEKTIAELQAKMIKAAENLEFEEAAALRDRIRKLEKEMSE